MLTGNAGEFVNLTDKKRDKLFDKILTA